MLKFALLGLLAKEPRHGYELKTLFEEILGGAWPLNEGQVYTTLARLERDGLVDCEVVQQHLLRDRKVYRLTALGWEALAEWLAEPVTGEVRIKDEFFVKVLIHSLVDSGDPLALIWSQREEYLRALAELNDLRSGDQTAATMLLLEGAALHVEADLRWLDICESRIDDLRSRR